MGVSAGEDGTSVESRASDRAVLRENRTARRKEESDLSARGNANGAIELSMHEV